MPDFKAISDLLGAIKGGIDGVTGIFGSLGGEDLVGNLITLGSIEAPVVPDAG